MARFEWSGSGIVARFTGTGIAATLGGVTGRFTLVVDGAINTIDYDGRTSPVPLASGLSAGEHQVELYRRPEADKGTMHFSGFTVTGGALVASPPPFSRRIELVGDSITCGYGNEGASQYCSFTYATENEYLTYGAIAARALQAEHHTIAWSGFGMVRGYGQVPEDRLPRIYERTLPKSDFTSTWDFSQWTPDVVVINLGTNDWNGGDPGTPYNEAYLAFLAAMRARYPQAHVFCAMGPMALDNEAAQWRARLGDIIAARRAAGDSRVHLIEFPTQDGSLGYGCDWHPSLDTHEQMANQLVTAVKAVTGW